MTSDHAEPAPTDHASEAAREMAEYGIASVQISHFFYGGYRYTQLSDAVAEAKRHPVVATDGHNQGKEDFLF